ncbi:MAG: hypothetical protein FJ211_04590 [Ignavibacteria bacterium]|nr:hypothetical protein [Ignavibacteria bacterium]
MGAITRIRQISPYFLAVIATLFIVFMVVQDSSCTNMRNARSGASSMNVAEVNGDVITAADFEARVKEVIEGQRKQNPNQEIDDETLRQQVFDEMVNELLRKQEADKLGIVVTPQQIIDVLLVNPPDQFQFGKDTAGRFDPKMQWQLVTNPESQKELLERNGLTVEKWQEMLLQTEDYLRSQMLQQAVASAVGTAVSTPSYSVTKQQFIRDSSAADIEFLALSSNRVRDADVQVTDAAIAAYYEKNKAYYKQRPGRAIKFIAFPPLASGEDSVNAEKKSQRLAETFAKYTTLEQRDSAFSNELVALKGTEVDYTSPSEMDPSVVTVLASLAPREVFGPLNVASGIAYYRLDGKRDGDNPIARASHILIPFGVNKDSAKAEANSVLAKAKKGDDFADLARTYSKDPGSAQQGGDLNYFGKGRMVKEFDSAVFAANAGSIIGPIETQFGYHVIKVAEKMSVEYKYSAVTIKAGISSTTKRAIAAAAEDCMTALEAGESFESVATKYTKKFNAQVQETPVFSSETPVLQSRELTAWAFENESGAVTRREIKYYGTVVAQVSDQREAGIKTLADMRERIKRTLTDRMKLQKLESQAKQLAASAASQGLASARGGDSTIAYSTQIGLKDNGMLTGYGSEYAVTSAAFKLPVNAVSGAIKGENGWFVIRVTKRQDANLNEFAANLPSHLQSVSQRMRNNAYGTWFQKVRETADITDKRFSSSN